MPRARGKSVHGRWQVPRICKLKETVNRIEVTRDCGQEGEEILYMNTVFLLRMKNVRYR